VQQSEQLLPGSRHELAVFDLSDSFDEMKMRARIPAVLFPYLYDGEKKNDVIIPHTRTDAPATPARFLISDARIRKLHIKADR